MPNRPNNRRRRNRRKMNRANNPTGLPGNPWLTNVVNDKTAQYGEIRWNEPRVYRFSGRSVTTGFASTGGGLIQFSAPLNDPSALSQWTSAWVNLFDQFRVKSVRVTTQPEQVANVTSGPVARPFYVLVDYDSTSTTPPASADACLQYGNCKSYDILKDSYTVIQVPAYSSSGVPTGWIDCASPLAQGKIWIASFALTASTVYYAAITIEYFIEFRSTR